jgi:hypothetical protein
LPSQSYLSRYRVRVARAPDAAADCGADAIFIKKLETVAHSPEDRERLTTKLK